MKQIFIFLFTIAFITTANAQTLSSTTARSYLESSTTFTQAQFDAYNSQPGMYQIKLPTDSTKSSAMILKYPSMDSVNVYWANGVWNLDTATAITTNFNTLLIVNYASIGHIQASVVPGATTSSVTFDWADVSNITQYRFRIRPINGSWNVSTVTGSQRTITTLIPNTTYEVMIRVFINSTTQGEYSQIYTFTTLPMLALPPCNSPTIKTKNVNNNILTVTWDSMPNAVGYQIQARTLNSMTWGGTTVINNSWSQNIAPNTSYELQIRTSCTNASSPWSLFTNTDTIINAVCASPTGMYNVGNTFYWTPNKYAEKTQIQHRLVGTQNWGGTTVTGNSWTNLILWGRHEWRVRSTCYATTNTGWTSFSPIITTNFISNPNSFEEFQSNVAYPNPANNTIMYNGEIKIQDMTGRLVLVGENEVDVNHLPNGLYFVNGMKHIIQH